MGILECDGVFQVVLPDGWTVTGKPGDYYDVVPPADQDLAVNISVYPVSKAIRAEGSAQLLRRFVASTGAPTG